MPKYRKTPFGKTKTFSGLSGKEKIFLVLSVCNLLTAYSLTVYSMIKVLTKEGRGSDSPDFTFTVLLLVNALFCMYYIVHGVLRERVYELVALVATIVVVVLYCILEFALNHAGCTAVKLVRLILVCLLAPPNIVNGPKLGCDYVSHSPSLTRTRILKSRRHADV